MLRELQGRKFNLASSFVHSAVSLYPRLSKTKNCAGRLEISVKLGCQNVRASYIVKNEITGKLFNIQKFINIH